ncbi:MAG: hypothetical protein QM722_20710 [Piscinibacter sp.]
MKPTALLPRLACLLALLAALPAYCLAASIGIVTIADGDLAVLRDTQRFAASEGLRLRNDDVLRTAADARLARIELTDGTVLDLGPDTELLLQPSAGGAIGERAATLYLARGWLKVTAAREPGTSGIASPTLDLQRLAGTAVLALQPGATLLFVETGEATAAELRDGRSGRPLALADGDALVRRGNEAPTIARRPPADLLARLPRAFADSLPRRAARFQARPVEPAGAVPVSYAEAARWINGEPALRAAAVSRFTPRASDAAFRAALVAELKSHPEWDRVLFPEKYRPKPVTVARREAPAASQPAAAALAVNLHGVMAWPGTARDAAPNP